MTAGDELAAGNKLAAGNEVTPGDEVTAGDELMAGDKMKACEELKPGNEAMAGVGPTGIKPRAGVGRMDGDRPTAGGGLITVELEKPGAEQVEGLPALGALAIEEVTTFEPPAMAPLMNPIGVDEFGARLFEVVLVCCSADEVF